MHQEKYSLTWHTYSDHLRSMMKELMMNEDFADVTLVTEDRKQIKAHINILSACSPVFRDIFKKEKSSNQIMYLRGIQFPEMESIMQFIYLGEATFYEERMDEFFAVAKSLEIKELCKAGQEMNDEPDDEAVQRNLVEPTENVEDKTIISDHVIKQAPKQRRREVVGIENKYECVHCHKTFYNSSTKRRHERTVHEGVKYACDQCDYQFTDQGSLKRHIQSTHEGVKYACDQCDYQFTTQVHLKVHIQNKHEGVRFECDQCNYQAGEKRNLRTHIKNKHEVLTGHTEAKY